jgi:hypothetical protein
LMMSTLSPRQYHRSTRARAPTEWLVRRTCGRREAAATAGVASGGKSGRGAQCCAPLTRAPPAPVQPLEAPAQRRSCTRTTARWTTRAAATGSVGGQGAIRGQHPLEPNFTIQRFGGNIRRSTSVGQHQFGTEGRLIHDCPKRTKGIYATTNTQTHMEGTS